MQRALIVTSSDSSKAFLENFFSDSFTAPVQVTSVASGAAARRLISEREFEVILVNAPLSDESGIDLSIGASESTACGIVLVVKGEIEEETACAVEDYGVLTVSKPIHKATLSQAIRLAAACNMRLTAFQAKARDLQTKIEEIRIIDKAKYALIQYLGMTEADAHRYIEKQAMDRRVAKRTVAGEILKQYS